MEDYGIDDPCHKLKIGDLIGNNCNTMDVRTVARLCSVEVCNFARAVATGSFADRSVGPARPELEQLAWLYDHLRTIFVSFLYIHYYY